jgi:hypothetical protein
MQLVVHWRSICLMFVREIGEKEKIISLISNKIFLLFFLGPVHTPRAPPPGGRLTLGVACLPSIFGRGRECVGYRDDGAWELVSR